MLRSQRDDPIALAVEEWLAGDDKSVGRQLHQGGECLIQLVLGAGVENMQPDSKSRRRSECFLRPKLRRWIRWIREISHYGRGGLQFLEQFETFRPKQGHKRGHSSDVPARSVKACNETERDRVAGGREHDRN